MDHPIAVGFVHLQKKSANTRRVVVRRIYKDEIRAELRNGYRRTVELQMHMDYGRVTTLS